MQSQITSNKCKTDCKLYANEECEIQQCTNNLQLYFIPNIIGWDKTVV